MEGLSLRGTTLLLLFVSCEDWVKRKTPEVRWGRGGRGCYSLMFQDGTCGVVLLVRGRVPDRSCVPVGSRGRALREERREVRSRPKNPSDCPERLRLPSPRFSVDPIVTITVTTLGPRRCPSGPEKKRKEKGSLSSLGVVSEWIIRTSYQYPQK